jgi:VIT1/CCC1 family predicted Fe2+/Mn2+ transporter
MDYGKAERRRETWEIENYPEGEKREMVEIYVSKGMNEEDARTVVDIFARNKETWIDVMMIEELGIVESDESPVRNGIVTFFSFALFGLVPLLAYVAVQVVPLPSINTFAVACVLTAATLFALGALKVRITGRSWIASGLETLTVGGIAAVAAYAIGMLLRGLVQV